MGFQRFLTTRITAVGFAIGVLVATTPSDAIAQTPSKVVVAAAETRDITTTQSFVGTIVPARRAIVGSAVEGRVLEFAAQEGQRVSQGDTLARLRSETLEIQADAARAELILRQSELEELENTPLPEELEQATARLNRAKIVMDSAKRKFDRTRNLYNSNAVTDDEMDQATLAYEQSEQAFVEAKAHHKLVSDGPRPEKIAQAKARVATQQKNVEALEDQIAKHTIHAPFDGYVVTESSQVGEWVERGGEICEIVQLDQVDVKVHILASQVGALKRGLTVTIRLPHNSARQLEGRIAQIVPQTDENSRAIPVLIRLENPIDADQPLLKSGMLANAFLPTERRSKVTVVPKDALVLNPRETVLYVVHQRGEITEVRKIVVQAGISDDSWIEVTGDIEPGQKVVVEGNERLNDRSQIIIQSTRNYSAAPTASR